MRAAADDVEVWTLRNFAAQRLTLLQSAYPSEHHPTLGWVPKRGYEGREDNVWNTRVSIDDRGFRNNGAPRPPGRPILIVGDSFAFGDEVNDEDTIAARLEAHLGVPVINAGVFGYGIDQSVLRAEGLLDELSPTAVVLQAVRDDVVRAQMSVRTGVEKPYFLLSEGRLVLHNVPTSPRRPVLDDLGLARRTLGYSYLVDWTMRAVGQSERWYLGRWEERFVHDDLAAATEVGCRLVARLGAELRTRRVRGVFVAQYARHVLRLSPPDDPWIAPLARLVACAEDAGFAIVDTYVSMRPIADADPERYAKLYRAVHFSREGNEFVAKQIAAQLAGEGGP